MSKPVSIIEIETYFWRLRIRQPWLLAGSFFMAPAVVLRTIVAPLFVAQAFSRLAQGRPVDGHILIFAVAALALGVTLEHIGNRCLAELDIVNTRVLYNRCFQWLIRQDYSFYANEFIGTLVAKSNRFVKAYEMGTFIIFMQLIGLYLSVLIAFGVMIHFSMVLGLVAFGAWLFSVGLTTFLTVRRIPIRRKAVAADSKQAGDLADAIGNAITIKTFAREDDEERRYDEGNVFRANRYRISWAIAVRNGTVIRSLAAMLQGIVFIGGVLAIEAHTITLATFLLFQVYIVIIINSLFETQLITRNLEGVYGDADEMMQVLRQPTKIKDPVNPEASRIAQGAIVFKQVKFQYPGHAKDSLFHEFTVSIKAGERIGLVGPSGGGKTTITKLLLRFLDVQSGIIAVDGQDIRMITQDDLHRAISYVPQEPLLFHRTLGENIGYGKEGATKAEIIEAARKAYAADFIETLPKKYDTLVGERGIKLSGGQRQRIALARTMLKDAPIIVLDEPTSALDSESERMIQKALSALMEGKTSIVIAHRLSTIKHLDRIIVLDDGSIIESGTHDELLARSGVYATLWSHQSDGFIE